MSEKNGNVKWWQLSAILIVLIPVVTGYIYASDKEREKGDVELRADLNSCVKEQMLTNQQILVSLAEIKEQIKRI